MQIYGPSQIHGAQPISAPHSARATESSSVSPSSSMGDRLDISEAGQLAGRLAELPEMRTDRVQELRTAILNGSYETDAKLDVALDRLLDEIA
jgi:negative regulator of flagellin synthesis FlgM